MAQPSHNQQYMWHLYCISTIQYIWHLFSIILN